MSLKNKAAKIGFADLDTPRPTEPTEAPPPSPALPRARSGVAAISQSIGLHHRLQDLEATVASYEKGGAVVPLDPKRVRASRWKNRHESSYVTEAFAQLKAEIEAVGGNVQPIKVRRVGEGSDGAGEFELVYGRRRHRACLELGLPVNSIVQQLNEVELFQEMERENRHRADLSPWEQGVMYRDALDQGLFPSQRQLAAALGVDQSNLSKALRLAALPAEVVDAFPSPLELQFRWGIEIADAFEKNPARVLAAAEEVKQSGSKPSAKDVYLVLIGAGKRVMGSANRHEFRVGQKVVGSWSSASGTSTLRLKQGVLGTSGEKKLLEFVEAILKVSEVRYLSVGVSANISGCGRLEEQIRFPIPSATGAGKHQGRVSRLDLT